MSTDAESNTEIAKKVWKDNCSAVPEFMMNGCCGKHDTDYKTKGKFTADWKFLGCGWKKAGSYGWRQPHKVAATVLVSTTYYIGVSLFGWRRYFKAQKETDDATT